MQGTDMVRLLRLMRVRLIDHMRRHPLVWRFKSERPLTDAERRSFPDATVAWEVEEADGTAEEVPPHMGLPPPLRAFFEAANNCTALCAGLCLAWPRLQREHGRRLCMLSSSLGKCTVVGMHVAAGIRLVDHAPAYNPLLVGSTMTPILLLPPPDLNRRRVDGQLEGEGNLIYTYGHNWLALRVRQDATGEHHPVSIDPTAAQFGSTKDILVWHHGLPEAMSLYGKDYGVNEEDELLDMLDQAVVRWADWTLTD